MLPISLITAVDAKNERALKYLDQLHSKRIKATRPNIQFNFIAKVDNLNQIIEESELLKEHEFFLREIKHNTKYLLGEKEEIIISKMKNTGSRAWSKLQNMITSTLLVDIEIDGEIKKLPLPVVRNIAHSKDAALRKKSL